jgi:hypothetical protein
MAGRGKRSGLNQIRFHWFWAGAVKWSCFWAPQSARPGGKTVFGIIFVVYSPQRISVQRTALTNLFEWIVYGSA